MATTVSQLGDGQALVPVTIPPNGGTIQAHADASLFLPVMEIQQAMLRYNAVLAFSQQIMHEGQDYGKVPGVDKPSLLKAGAEKLCNFFGLTPTFEEVERIEEWGGEAKEPFFFYRYRCKLWRGNRLIAEGLGSCNSHETKYRYRWVTEEQIPVWLKKELLPTRGGVKMLFEFDFALQKAETTGQYGKPESHWQMFRDAIGANPPRARRVEKETKRGKSMGWEIAVDSTLFRIPNLDVAEQANTIDKMAQKRSLVAATLIGTNASAQFTQDVEDMQFIEVTPQPITPTGERHEDLVQRRIAEEQAKADKRAEAKQGSPEPPKQAEGKPPFRATDDDLPHNLGGPKTDDAPSATAKVDEARQRAAQQPNVTRQDFQTLRLAYLGFGAGGGAEYDRIVQRFGAEKGAIAPPTRKKAYECFQALTAGLESLRQLKDEEPPEGEPQQNGELFGGGE
jgi:hypothetical protein